MTQHNHRIIPGYEGGKYVEGNVVALTVTQHAMWHFAEWTRKRNLRDELAWKGLAGIIGKEELVAELMKLNKGFSGKKHSDEWKENNGRMMKKLHTENPERREQIRQLGKGDHKRNTSSGTESMSGPNKRQYMRRHWRKEVWDDLKETYENRKGYHWGKNRLSKNHCVSAKTLENMLDLIIEGVDWDTATNLGHNL